MALKLEDCSASGPALSESFLRLHLEGLLQKAKLLPPVTGSKGHALQAAWETSRGHLRRLREQGGPIAVAARTLDPLLEPLGYTSRVRDEETIETREGEENAGWMMRGHDGALRVWAVAAGTDLDAPSRRGRAYRFSPMRVAARVLEAKKELLGLLTDGDELRLILCAPGLPASHLSIHLDGSGGWRSSRAVPDSYRVLLALASPAGVKNLPSLFEQARLRQTEDLARLREQAQSAVQGFIQGVLDHPANAAPLERWDDPDELAKRLWREALVVVYRLLFVFKLEASSDTARSFSFATTSLWRQTYSPNTALGRIASQVLGSNLETGRLLEDGLRSLFKLFVNGLTSSELRVAPLGGMLFGPESIELLQSLAWGEQAVARLIDRLLYSIGSRADQRRRVFYGSLDVEDLGRVYEALLELDPGIAHQRMCRLRRDKLETVVPAEQGESYRESSGKKKSKVEWIEEIPAGRFYLRAGLGRKSSGSYYTPHPFVRFLVQETLGPQVEERSPRKEPNPGRLLELRVIDPAMGSGHFLVEACRYLGDKLYEACRLCDELATAEEEAAAKAKTEAERNARTARARELRRRVEALPDPEEELLAYLPSRIAEGDESGVSQRKAEALCRRLVAVHCLYGVDKSELAVALAKMSLWLESYAEGLPLTFLDHRLVWGDSLTGPTLEQMLTAPGSGEPLEGLHAQGLRQRLESTLEAALTHVRDLEATVGKDVADLELKRDAKEKLDRALAPFVTVATVWSGGVRLGIASDNVAYLELVERVARGEDAATLLTEKPKLREMRGRGFLALPFELAFPEVFYPRRRLDAKAGFDAVLGNPPWERIEASAKEFLLSYQAELPEDESEEFARERLEHFEDAAVAAIWRRHCEQVETDQILHSRLYVHQREGVSGRKTVGRPDTYRLFAERGLLLCKQGGGSVGWVVPSSFYSNEGSTGIRTLYLSQSSIEHCYSFENRKRLFSIDTRQKFAVLVARRHPSGTSAFWAAFYLEAADTLFDGTIATSRFRLTPGTITEISGEYRCFPECRSSQDLEMTLVQVRRRFENWAIFLQARRIKTAFGVELHRNPQFSKKLEPARTTAELFEQSLQMGWKSLPLHAGRTTFQYTDQYDSLPATYVLSSDIVGARHWLVSVPHYRLVYRMKACSTNERSMIACLITPGFVCEQTLVVESAPAKRANSSALLALAVANSYLFDWHVRQRITTSLSNYILAQIPVPTFGQAEGFCVHSALRLSCNHAGYAALWREQLGDAWREPGRASFSWPVVASDAERWAVRAAIDAIVADAYGLDRDQYAHILSSFSHKSFPDAPALCLAAFDALRQEGVDAFVAKRDPYHDIPLVTTLPRPVIELPEPSAAALAKAGRAATAETQTTLFDGTSVDDAGDGEAELEEEEDEP